MKAALLAAALLALGAHAQPREPKPEVFAKFSQWTKARTAAKGDAAFIARSLSDGPTGAKEAAQLAVPSTPITDDQGKASFEGVYLAIVGLDQAGKPTGVRPAKAGFRTGERFKLRAVSTFGAHLVIENINAKGERRQIYPAASQVVVLRPGADTLLPLGEKQFFEFARTTGEEQLVVTLRDPRAIGDAASRQKIYRKDEALGTYFVQEVAKGTFPAIAESLRLEHR